MFKRILGARHDRKYVFLHIPKTAGSTFRNIIAHNYSESERFHATAGNEKMQDYYELVEKPIQALGSKINSYKIVHGHFYFGIHKYFRKPNNVKYICLVRDPIDRILSEYYYIRATSWHPLHDTCLKISLHEFATNDSISLNNTQVRLLSGIKLRADRWDNDIPNLAKENINQYFELVCTTELFDKKRPLILNKLGWNNLPSLQRQNITKQRKMVEDISQDILEDIKEKNRHDISFYEWIKSNIK